MKHKSFLLKLSALSTAFLVSGLANAGPWTLPALQLSDGAVREHVWGTASSTDVVPVMERDGVFYSAPLNGYAAPVPFNAVAGKTPVAVGYSTGVSTPSYVAYSDGTIVGRNPNAPANATNWQLNYANLQGELTPVNNGQGSVDIVGGNLVGYGKYASIAASAPAGGVVLASNVRSLLTIEDSMSSVMSHMGPNPSAQQQLYYLSSDNAIHKYTLGSVDGTKPVGEDTVLLSSAGGAGIKQVVFANSLGLGVINSLDELWYVPQPTGTAVRLVVNVKKVWSLIGANNNNNGAKPVGGSMDTTTTRSMWYSGAWRHSMSNQPEAYRILLNDGNLYSVGWNESQPSGTFESGKFDITKKTPLLTNVKDMVGSISHGLVLTNAGSIYVNYGLQLLKLLLNPVISTLTANTVNGNAAQMLVTVNRDDEAYRYRVSVKATNSGTWTALSTVDSPSSGSTVQIPITLPAAQQNGAAFDLKVEAIDGFNGVRTSKSITAFANAPITGVSASAFVFAVDSSVANPTSANVYLNYVDSNGTLDTYTTEVVTQPQHGTVSITTDANGSSKLSYLPKPDLQYLPGATATLNDSFTIRTTDAAGTSVTGTANVIIKADTAPVVVTAKPVVASTYQGDSALVEVTYNANTVSAAHRIEQVIVMNSKGQYVGIADFDSVETLKYGAPSDSSLESGKGKKVTVKLPIQTTPDTYSYQIVMSSSVSGDYSDVFDSGIAEGELQVKALPMPAVSVSKTSLTTEDVVTMNIATPTSNCSWTYDAAAAQTNSNLCLLTPVGSITRVAQELYKFTGHFEPGQHVIGVKVSRLIGGSMVELGEVTQTLTVTQAVAPTFVAGTPEQRLQGLGGVTLLEQLTIPMTQSNKAAAPTCGLYADRVGAAQAATSTGRGCYVVVDSLPAGISLVRDNAANSVSLVGKLQTEGTNPVALRIFRVNEGMQDTLVDTQSFSLTGKPVAGSGSVTYTLSNTAPHATIDKQTVTFAGVGTCAQLTTDVAEATASQKCLLEVNPGIHSFTLDASKPLSWSGTYSASGVQGLAYTLSVMSGGQKVVVATGSVDASVGNAPLPLVTPTWTPLTDVNNAVLTDEAGQPLIAVPLTGAIGTVGIKGIAPLVAKVTAPGYESSAAVQVPSQTTLSLTAPLAERSPGNSYPVSVRVEYKTDANTFVNVQATAVQVPDFKSLSIKPTFASTLNTAGSLSVTAGVKGGAVYDVSQVGTWKVFPAVSSTLDGSLLPLVANTDYSVVSSSSADGTVTLSIPASRFSSLLSKQNVVAVAEYYYGNTVLKRLVSSAINPTLVDLTPLRSVTLSANRVRGTIPFTPSVTANVPAVQKSALGTVDWMLSSDGGETWQPAGTGQSFGTKLKTTGQFKLKAIAHLKADSNITTESAAIDVSTYEVPTLAIGGRSYALVSRPMTQTLAARHIDGSAADASRINWSVVDSRSNAVLASGTGPEVSFTPTTAGTVVVRAAYVGDGANAKMPSEIAAKQFGVSVAPLDGMVPRYPASVRVTDRAKVKLEGNGVLRNASVLPAEVGVEWLLPGGEKLAGRAVEWTVSAEDVAALQSGTALKMRVWLVGYEAETSVTTDVPTKLIAYQFPTVWNLTSSKSLSAQAPATFQTTVAYDAAGLSADQVFLLRNEKLTYTWSLPEGMTGRADGASARVVANWKGSYPVSVEISDTRGNTATATGTFTVLDAPEPTVDLNMRGLSKNNRTPAEFQVRAAWKRGHPLDKLIGVDVLVDGQVVIANSTQSSINLSIPGVGEHEVKLVAKSALATVESDPAYVTVAENTAPTVQLNAVVSKDGKTAGLQAVAADADGKVKSITWTREGVLMKGWTGSERRTVELTGAPVTYTVTVSDDSGESASSSVTVQR